MQVLSYFGFFKVLKVTATSSRLLAIGSLSLFIWHLASGNWHLKTVRDYKCWQKDRFTTNPSCNSFKTLNAESQTLQLSFHKPLSQKGGETASASLNEFFSILIVSVFYHIKHQPIHVENPVQENLQIQHPLPLLRDCRPVTDWRRWRQ